MNITALNLLSVNDIRDYLLSLDLHPTTRTKTLLLTLLQDEILKYWDRIPQYHDDLLNPCTHNILISTLHAIVAKIGNLKIDIDEVFNINYGKFKLWIHNNRCITTYKDYETSEDGKTIYMALDDKQIREIDDIRNVNYNQHLYLELHKLIPNPDNIITWLHETKQEYKIGNYTLKTLPYDCKGIWPYDYVMAYCDIDIHQYYEFWRYFDDMDMLDKRIFMRHFTYMLSVRTDVSALLKVSSLCLEDDPIDLLSHHILNWPTIAMYMSGHIIDYFYPFLSLITTYIPRVDLYCGQRENLFKYINTSTQTDVYLCDRPKIPHCIEDYINPRIARKFKGGIFACGYPQLNPSRKRKHDDQCKLSRYFVSPNDFPHVEYNMNIKSLSVVDDPNFGICLVLYADLLDFSSAQSANITRGKFSSQFIKQFDLLDDLQAQRLMQYLNIHPVQSRAAKVLKYMISQGYIDPTLYTLYVSRMINYNKLNSVQKQVYSIMYTDHSEDCNDHEIRDANAYIFAAPILHHEIVIDSCPRPIQIWYRDIADIFNMCIPHNISAQKYITHSLNYAHKSMMSNDIEVNQYNLITISDMKLIKLMNINSHHKSRKTLVKLARQLLFPTNIRINPLTFEYYQSQNGTYKKMFFIPKKRCSINTKFISNPFDDGDNPSNINIPVIAYGTLHHYILYNIEELTSGFMPFGDGDGLRLSRILDIDGKYQYISIDTVNQLIEVASYLKCEDLLREINCTLKFIARNSQYDIKLINTFSYLSIQDHKNINICLHDIFYMGMYFRQWRGPEHAYPLTTTATQVTGFNPDIHTAEARYKFIIDFEQLSTEAQTFIRELMIVEHSYGQVIKSQSTTFGEIWDTINGINSLIELEDAKKNGNPIPWIGGDYCIRIASTRLIGTAYYYIKLLFNHIIPNYNPKHIRQIS